MNFLGNPACVMYTVLKIIEQERAFIDPDTLEEYHIIKEHLKYYASKCNGIEANYELVFRNNIEKRADYIKKELIQNFINNYYHTYINVTGKLPPPPEYIYGTPDDLSALNKLMKNGNARSRKLRRKNRKTRRQRN